MKCQVCKEKIDRLLYVGLAHTECDLDSDGELSYDDIEFEDTRLGYYCGNCGGFLTTDEDEAKKILKDKTDKIYKVVEKEPKVNQ